jgi:hypothetical protein
MYFIKIDDRYINLERVTSVKKEAGTLWIGFGGGEITSFYGNEAKALAQLLDNLSTKVMVEGDATQ